MDTVERLSKIYEIWHKMMLVFQTLFNNVSKCEDVFSEEQLLRGPACSSRNKQ